jgi:hypothetical protein
MRRFWDLAFLTPSRPGFLVHAWKAVEDQVWGFVAGDPLVDRRPFLVLLHVASVLVVLLVLLGAARVARTRGGDACWWLAGPVVLTMLASAARLFPIAPRLTLFLLPGLITLFVAGLADALGRLGEAGARRRLAITTAVVVLPLEFDAVARTFALEPSGHFQLLVRELRERRAPGEPVYVFVRSLPAWIFYSTDWSRPDTARVAFLSRAASAEGAAFENAPSRGRVRPDEPTALSDPALAPGEIIGLPSGMEWRENQEHVGSEPDSGWVETERERIERAASPGVWVLATTWYAPEADLFRTLQRDAVRRTYANLRGGSALVRYEFGRRNTSPSAGR